MRLAADAAHEFGGIELDRSKPLIVPARRAPHRRLCRRHRALRRCSPPASIPMAPCRRAARPDRAFCSARCQRNAARRCRWTGCRPPMASTSRPSADAAAELSRQSNSLRHRARRRADPDWLRASPGDDSDRRSAGRRRRRRRARRGRCRRRVAGRSVILVERRPWLGGDARYFGPVGDEETPEAFTTRLARLARRQSQCHALLRAPRFSRCTARAPCCISRDRRRRRARPLVAITADRVLLATGATQRLPIFPGNRLPGVMPAIAAYHLAKRYGVMRATAPSSRRRAITAIAWRCGSTMPASRSAASSTRGSIRNRASSISPRPAGLTLASGQLPLSAERGRFIFAHSAGTARQRRHRCEPVDRRRRLATGAGVVDAGGRRCPLVAPSAPRCWPPAASSMSPSPGRPPAIARCAPAPRAAAPPIAALFGGKPRAIDDARTGTASKRPMRRSIAQASADTPIVPRFRPQPCDAPGPDRREPALPRSHAMELGDVAASVELELIAPGDAGAIAEERGAPGADLVASTGPAAAGDRRRHARLSPRPLRRRSAARASGRRRQRRFADWNAGLSQRRQARSRERHRRHRRSRARRRHRADRKIALKRDPRFIVELAAGASPARLADARSRPTSPSDGGGSEARSEAT